MSLRSTLPHPSIFETYSFNAELPDTTAPHDDDLVAVYKRSNSVRRQNLLGIMSASLIEQLRDSYLKELDAAIAQLEAQHHHASIPARVMADEIRAKKLSDTRTFDILHKTIDLAVTPATSPDFQQKTDDFRITMNQVKSDAKTNLIYGAAMAFGAAMCAAGIIVLSVLTFGPGGILNAKNVIGGLFGLGVYAPLAAIWSASFLHIWKQEKSMADKMQTFDTAMHEAPANAPAPKL